jgi:hypothetical protein
MSITYNTDNPRHMEALKSMFVNRPDDPGYRPRKSVYGENSATKIGLYPVDAVPDALIDLADMKEVIEECHAKKIFPKYHQFNTWAPDGEFASYQNGLNYCWGWSGTACLMDVEAIEDRETVMLAPVSMGYLVGWANAGNYLESFIKGAREEGIAPAQAKGFNDTTRSKSFWAQFSEQRKEHRLDGVWDCNNNAGDKVMLQHALSVLAYGRPLYIAYDWWGHALECVSMLWTENTYLNVTMEIRNSHGEKTLIKLDGSRCIFSEAYGFISTKPTELKTKKVIYG